MDTIYAPWRIEYIRGERPAYCVFCEKSAQERLVVYEGRTAFVMLNLYPYNCGHLMVIPFRHIGAMEELSAEEKIEMFDLLDVSLRVLKEAMGPDGFNIGMNLGWTAGAGIEDHIHFHAVPRWSGDTNFMSVVADVRVVPEDIIKTGERLLPYFKKYHREV